MSAALHLAASDDLNTVEAMVAAYHTEAGIVTDLAHRRDALLPLLEGSPLGCIYLIGPRKAPIGYVVISFGWSVKFGGMDGFVDELFIRSGVRGRGVATEVLHRLIPQLESAGLRALHLEASNANPRLQRLYARAGFRLREGYALMTRAARPRRN
ncbi:MAG: GNAT family N-acetyltransferase [Alphaproteobacteria bacterium]|nr:GNAT family N-acetyltransferase [Alphaproteobacteria bacterium]